MAFCYTRINKVNFPPKKMVLRNFYFLFIYYKFIDFFRVCKPGGYIEFTEPELATNTGPILTRFYDARKSKKFIYSNKKIYVFFLSD